MRLFDVRVVCREEYKSAQQPEWVVLGDARLRVAEILDRWYEGALTAGATQVDYFKVRLEDGRRIILRHVAAFDRWAAMEAAKPV